MVLIMSIGNIQAQLNYSEQNENDKYAIAFDLFQKEKFSSAQKYFKHFIDEQASRESIKKVNAEYYIAVCAIRLYNDDAEYHVVSFVNEYPESSLVHDIILELGFHYFNREKYDDAIEWLEKIDRSELKKKEFAEYYFNLGYSYFQENELEKARLALFQIKDIESKYAGPSIYYYAHINYQQENYETALKGFLRLTDNEDFGGIVPYYITQIYYMQKKYDEVISYAPSLMEQVIPKRKAEVTRIIGESFYRKNRFKEAIPYLETYSDEVSSTSADDKYQLAYCYYQTNDLLKAVALFEKISNGENAISQSALYHLGDIYLQLEEKDKARIAFSGAANLDFDQNIKEDALFNYAKLTYEISYSPFNDAIRAFNKYLRLYPDSEKKDEVYNFLVMAYLNAKNYRLALNSIEKISDKDENIKKAYQQIAFYRALELYNNLQFEESIDLLYKSLDYARYNPSINARAYYWIGEALYRQNEYDNAIENYDKFLLLSGSYQLNEYKLAHYNMGYSFFKKNQYDDALTWFRKYINVQDKKDITVADANNRVGDCYFIKANYWQAINYYEEAIALGTYDVDYALFQKGFALGLLNRAEKKIASLNTLLNNYNESAYADDALYELGRSYVSLENDQRAIQFYTKLIDEYPNSSYKKKTLVQLGLIHYNLDQNSKALEYYKQVAEGYPGTREAKDALFGIKNIYLDMNDVDAYFAYAKSLGGEVDVSVSEQDSLTYKAAENIYMTGDCSQATDRLRSYLEKFPNGAFKTNAHFYFGDCNYTNKNYDKALESFQYVINQPKNMFTEQALLGAARINYANENYREALENYRELERVAEVKNNVLEARIGLMRTNYLLGNFDATVEAANELLLTEKISSEMEREARYKIAKSYLALNQREDALDEFRRVATEVTSKEGAEAKYRVVEILHEKGDYEKAEEEIFEFIDQNTPHQYWMAKSFLTLADIYIHEEDYFQAGHTLQSIIDYYESQDDGIITAAKAKKEMVMQHEEEINEMPDQEEIEIDISEQQ